MARNSSCSPSPSFLAFATYTVRMRIRSSGSGCCGASAWPKVAFRAATTSFNDLFLQASAPSKSQRPKLGRHVYTEAMIARQSAPVGESRQVLLIGAGVPAQDMFWLPVFVHFVRVKESSFVLCIQHCRPRVEFLLRLSKHGQRCLCYRYYQPRSIKEPIRDKP